MMIDTSNPFFDMERLPDGRIKFLEKSYDFDNRVTTASSKVTAQVGLTSVKLPRSPARMSAVGAAVAM